MKRHIGLLFALFLPVITTSSTLTIENFNNIASFSTNFDTQYQLGVNDWNPADNDIRWISYSCVSGQSGKCLNATYNTGDDLSEELFICYIGTNDFNWFGAKKIMISINNSFIDTNRNAFGIKLTMKDGSVWESATALTATGWHMIEFIIDNGAWTWLDWSPPGEFDVSNIDYWEISIGCNQSVNVIRQIQFDNFCVSGDLSQ